MPAGYKATGEQTKAPRSEPPIAQAPSEIEDSSRGGLRSFAVPASIVPWPLCPASSAAGRRTSCRDGPPWASACHFQAIPSIRSRRRAPFGGGASQAAVQAPRSSPIGSSARPAIRWARGGSPGIGPTAPPASSPGIRPSDRGDTPCARRRSEKPARADETIWAKAEEKLGDLTPLSEGYVVTRAKIAVKLARRPGGDRRRTLTLTITWPHGCDLKDRTATEQMIGEKYLRRWEILVDDLQLFED